jgi:hypothetical protein
MGTFRDRFWTRRTAETITAPSSILLGGAVTAVGIAAGAPIVAAVAAGAGAYAAWVAVRMPKGPQSPAAGEIDLHRLRDPWRWYVKEALESRARFRRAVGTTDPGPIRDRLASIGERLDDGVTESWRIASRGQDLESALAQLTPVDQVEQRISQLRAGPASETTDGLIEALQGQVESYRRIAGTAAEAKNKLTILEARLDEAVARAVELSVQTADTGALGGLQEDVQTVVSEMEALRRGLEETTGSTGTGQTMTG